MRKISLLFIFLTLIFTISIAKAEGVSLTPKSSYIDVYTGETASTEITIRNSQIFVDEFSIDIWPTYWNGISVVPDKPRVSIGPGSNEIVKLYFSAPRDLDEMLIPYNLTAISVRDPKVSALIVLNLKVLRSVPIYISEVNAEKYMINPGENVKIEIAVANSGSDVYTDASLNTKIKNDGIIFKEFNDNLEIIQGKSTQIVQHTIDFGKYDDAGKYVIEVFLKDVNGNVVSKRTGTSSTPTPTLKLEAVSYINVEKSVSYGLLLQTITIKVKNDGNTLNSTLVTESVPAFMKAFFFPFGQYTSESIGNMVHYHWLVLDLMPGEAKTITYQINVWSAWALVMIMIIIVVIAFKVVYVPAIVKGFRHAGPITREKEIQISLEAKNRSIHEIK
ncbi:MAG TPA: hypothetical protein VJ343_00810, partial [archaeon]|nr:hypothetical protein [archaeon]